MIGHVVWRGFVVVVAFFVAVAVALVVLFVLGAMWTGDELSAIAAADPAFRDFALQDPALQDPVVQRSVAMAFGAIVFIEPWSPH
ncbi:hypothetical protein AUC68_12630 [Methyloceanibacter methanicus]|uniref:Uncharacterized protein n=1 Tax=Methyloceanibacter methanicus TaxID=1774968 RepID=A0A1E3W5Y5_9HYPH|nr:hypothetical protein [Methyloceanibacter methanicus]ODS01204.1 hypothetical protein AUC68_12630 [Methyloceanibacter methanicus]